MTGNPSSRRLRLILELALERPIGVRERRQMDSMSRGDGLNFSDALWGDEPSTLREGLKATLQSKSHALEKTSVDHIGERMAIQNSKKIDRKSTRLNSSHVSSSYAVVCFKKKRNRKRKSTRTK